MLYDLSLTYTPGSWYVYLEYLILYLQQLSRNHGTVVTPEEVGFQLYSKVGLTLSWPRAGVTLSMAYLTAELPYLGTNADKSHSTRNGNAMRPQ